MEGNFGITSKNLNPKGTLVVQSFDTMWVALTVKVNRKDGKSAAKYTRRIF